MAIGSMHTPHNRVLKEEHLEDIQFGSICYMETLQFFSKTLQDVGEFSWPHRASRRNCNFISASAEDPFSSPLPPFLMLQVRQFTKDITRQEGRGKGWATGRWYMATEAITERHKIIQKVIFQPRCWRSSILVSYLKMMHELSAAQAWNSYYGLPLSEFYLGCKAAPYYFFLLGCF